MVIEWIAERSLKNFFSLSSATDKAKMYPKVTLPNSFYDWVSFEESHFVFSLSDHAVHREDYGKVAELAAKLSSLQIAEKRRSPQCEMLNVKCPCHKVRTVKSIMWNPQCKVRSGSDAVCEFDREILTLGVCLTLAALSADIYLRAFHFALSSSHSPVHLLIGH